MATDLDKLPSDDTDRLKRIAFWYWEYMRRNPSYLRFWEVFERYHDFFKSIDVFDSMQTKEYLDEMFEYLSTHHTRAEIRYTPFRRRLEANHGERAGKLFFKYGFLSCGFEKKFRRLLKDPNEGQDSDEALNKLFKGESVSFETDDIIDMSALGRFNASWLISVDGDSPLNFHYDLERTNSIKISPKGILDQPSKVGQEIHALNFTNKAVESLFEKQNVENETFQSFYKLNMSGKHINSSNVMRLAMIWLWDNAHTGPGTPRSFDEVYPLLKEKVEKAGMADGVWEQIMTRQKRIREYYASTDFCIQNYTITSLKN